MKKDKMISYFPHGILTPQKFLVASGNTLFFYPGKMLSACFRLPFLLIPI